MTELGRGIAGFAVGKDLVLEIHLWHRLARRTLRE